MALDRRTFLRAGTAGLLGGSALLGACSRPARPAVDITMTAGISDIDLGAGVVVRTWAWDGRVPANQIRLARGQTMRVELVNHLPTDTTTHWHGLAIPNAMDGVPDLTQQPVPPGGAFLYEFTFPDAGTYWAHPHFGSQLDRGMYAPLIVEDPDDGAGYDEELVLVLDDWLDGTGTNPDAVLEELRRSGMKPMAGGPGITANMPLGADGGDVGYPHFVINGRVPADPQVADYKPGRRIRLRIINAGGEVIAAPYGKDGHAQLNLRINSAPLSDRAADIGAFVGALNKQAPLNTATLVPTPEVTLTARAPENALDCGLSGPGHHGYNWLINGAAYDPKKPGMPVTEGQRTRIRFINESMMFHPMHLHGHTFEVRGRDGPRARKDTVLVPPMATVEVDFDADNPGKWISHCHNEYHLESGMATYLDYTR